MDGLIRRSDAIRAIEERSFAVRDSYTVKAIIRSIKAVEPKAESIIEACALETATREAYEEGMADAWKIAQAVFASEVTLYEAMDVMRCMKGADNNETD